jgi:hypothetical protein
MGRTWIVVAAMTLGGVLAPSASLAHSRATQLSNCAPNTPGAKIESNRRAQLYLKQERIYGCLRGSRHAIYLGRARYRGNNCQAPEQCPEVLETTLNRAVVAYTELSARPPEVVVVRSIRTGRILHRFPLHSDTPHNAPIEDVDATEIRVTPRGTVAWRQTERWGTPGDEPVSSTAFGVYAIEATGLRTLASGLKLVPGDLGLAGNTLSWEQEGTRESATLE